MTIPVDIETTGVSPLEQRLKGETAMIKFVQKYDEPLDCRNNWCNFDQAVLKFADESNQLNEEKTLNYNVIVPKNLNQMDMLSLVMKEYNEGKGKDFTDYTGVFGTNEYYFDKDASTVKTGNIQFDLKKDGENFILTLTNLGVVEELEVDDWSILYPFSPNTDELTTNVEGSYYGVQKELEKLFTETWGVEIGAAEFRKTSSKQKIYVEICQEGTSCEPLNWDPEREYPAMAYYHYHGGEKMLFFVGYEEGVKNLIGNFTKSIKDEKVTGLYKMLNADGKPYVITSPDLYYYAYLDLESGYPVDLDTDFGVGKVMHSLFLDVHGKDTAINSLPSNEQYTKALRGEHAELEQFLNRGGYTEYPNLVILKTTNTLQDLEKLEATGYGNSYFNFIFGDLSGKIGDSGSNELPDGIYFYKPGDGRDIGTYYVIGSTEPIIKGLLLLIAGDASLSPDSRLDGMYYYDGLGRYFYKLERKGYLIEDDYRVGIRDEMQGEITSLVTDGRSKARVYYIMWGSTGNDDCYLDSNNWFIVKDGVTPTDVTINGEEPIPGNVYEIYAEKNGEKYSININRIQYVSATGEVQTTGTGFYCCGEKHKDLKHFSDRKECEKDNWKFFTWEEDFDAWEIISDKVYYRQDLTEEEQNTCLLFDCNTYCKTIRLFEEGGVVSPSDPTKCICKGPGQLIETLDGPEIAGAGAVPDQELLPCGFIGEDQPCIKGQGNKWCPTLANAKYMCDTEESEGLFGKCKLDYSCKTNNDCVNWEDRKQCDTLTKECVMCTTNTHCTSRTDMGEWAFCNDDKICEDPGSTFTGAIVYHPRAVKDQCNGMEQDEYSFTGNQFVKLLPTGKEFLTETWSSPTKSAVGLQCGENWRTMEDDSGRDCDDNYDKDANELTTGCREAVLSDTDCRGGSLYIEGDDKYEDSPYYSEPAHCDYDELGKYIDFIGHCESDDGYEDPGDWDEYDWCKTHQRGDQRFCIRCPKDKPYICMSNQLITTLVDDDQDGIFDKMYNNVGTIGGKTGPSIICNENKDCASIGTYTEYLSSNQINGGDGGGIRRGVYKHAGGKITINSGEQPLKG